jgi:hypothetical protein
VIGEFPRRLYMKLMSTPRVGVVAHVNHPVATTEVAPDNLSRIARDYLKNEIFTDSSFYIVV